MSSSDPQPPRLPLAVPSIGGNAAAYLAECLETHLRLLGRAVRGPLRARVRRTRWGRRFAVACSSGTAALHLAFACLGVGPGDEVLVPTLTFVASANPCATSGRRRSWSTRSRRRSTWTRRSSSTSSSVARGRACGSRAAIEVVHLVGHPADLAPILAAAARFGVPVVEDASEALGAGWTAGPLAGRQVGTDREHGLLQLQRQQADHHRRRRAWWSPTTRPSPGRSVTCRRRRASPGATYDHDAVGFNYRLTNLAAALGVAQLEQLPELLAGRRDNARALRRRRSRPPRARACGAGDVGRPELLALHGPARGAERRRARTRPRCPRRRRDRRPPDLDTAATGPRSTPMRRAWVGRSRTASSRLR